MAPDDRLAAYSEILAAYAVSRDEAARERAYDLGRQVFEAGGQISAFNGGPFDLFGREICATNGRIHSALIPLLD